MSLVISLYVVTAVGAAVGWFIGVLMTAAKIEDLENQIAVLKSQGKKTVSNKTRIKKP